MQPQETAQDIALACTQSNFIMSVSRYQAIVTSTTKYYCPSQVRQVLEPPKVAASSKDPITVTRCLLCEQTFYKKVW